jgi:hypothetical protein
VSDLLAELLTALLNGVLPTRAGNVVVAVVMLLSTLCFGAVTACLTYYVIIGDVHALQVLPVVPLSALLTWGSYRLARKGLPKTPPDAPKVDETSDDRR